MADDDITKKGVTEAGAKDAGEDSGARDKPTQKIPSLEDGDHPETIGKIYKVIGKIGEGGMGTVYEVEHIRMGKRFAAKVILEQYAKDKEAIRRLELEAIAASKIESSHIVQVVHMDTEDDFTYIIMELLKGRSLAALIRKRAVTIPLAIEIGRQVAKGLVAAHEANIVHRDLKPENIFLTKQEDQLHVKILDFGISKIRGVDTPDVKLTKTGQIVGTPLYFSPEQARSLPDIDHRTDIYALGAIMFEMVTGEPVFYSASPVELMYKHISEKAPAPRGKNTQVDEKLNKVILRCLEKKVDDRYQTAGELLDALNEVDTEPISESAVRVYTTSTDRDLKISESTKMGVSFGTTIARGPRRVALVAGAVAVVLGITAVLLYLFLWSDRGSKEELGTHPPAVTGPEPEVAETVEGEKGTKEESEEETEEVPEVEEGEDGVEKVTLAFTSSPSGAEVWIDGEQVGNTDIMHEIEKDGEAHEVEIKVKDYKEEKFTIRANKSLSKHILLKKIRKPADKHTKGFGIKTVQ